MSFFNFLNENIVLPASDVLMGHSMAKNFNFLMESQFWSSEKLVNYQNMKLRALVKHAYENVDYYQEQFDALGVKPDDIKSIDDLKKLPILTKSQIRANINNGKLVAKNIAKSDMIYGCSSGSTGEPLQYYITKESHSFHYACSIRAWYWMGYRLGDKYVKLSQNPREKRIKKLQDKINRTLYLFAQQLTDDNFKLIVEEINRYRPKIIRGYPDPLFFLANYAKRNKIALYSPLAVNTTGNILFPEARELIQEQFGCKIFDSYSCEGGANVSECSTHDCYHSSMEYAITEILANETEVSPGDQGRLITTDLHNYAVPFIRYDTQDYVTKAKEKCTCGRDLLGIEKINGRDSDILITPKGKFLILHNFTGYFEWVDSVDQFQVRQEELDSFEIYLKVNSRYTSKVESEIYKYWMNYINEDVKLSLNVVEEIPLAPSGKRRFLIRNDKIKLGL